MKSSKNLPKEFGLRCQNLKGETKVRIWHFKIFLTGGTKGKSGTSKNLNFDAKNKLHESMMLKNFSICLVLSEKA